MDTAKNRQLTPLRLYLWLSISFYLIVFVQRLPPAYGIGTILGFSGALLVKLTLMFIGFFISAGLLILSYSPWCAIIFRLTDAIRKSIPRQYVANGFLFSLCLAIYLCVRFSSSAGVIDIYLPTWWLFGHLMLLGSLFLYANWQKESLVKSLAVTALVYGVIYQVSLFIPNISAYPLVMDWSEAGRLYNASTFFARHVYGTALPLPVLDASRALMQSIPFLVSGLPLWFHRLWEVLLWLGLTWTGGWALARRIKPGSRGLVLLLTAWVFLFFLQAPVYFHLMLMVVVVLLGFNRDHPRLSLVVVLLVSVWAGLGRVNWFPMPGLLAAVLYILETPYSGKNLWRYWHQPMVWVAGGTLAAFAVHRLYIPISQNPSQVFDSSFSSPLLWYRLWPNATYPQGIILALAWAIFPMIVILFNKIISRLRVWHYSRLLALAIVLGGLMVGGIVVSMKIGGGSNLHNLDAFLVLLAIVGCYVFCDRFIPDRPELDISKKAAWVWVVLVLFVLLVPLVSKKINVFLPASAYSRQVADLQHVLDTTNAQNGKVLFITQRQLVTFNIVHGVIMQPEYERVFLMEMAMANNQDYLSGYEKDLANHRYALIVFEPLTGQLKTSESSFAEENNAWLLHVTKPLLKYYQVQKTFKVLDIAVFEPCPASGCQGE